MQSSIAQPTTPQRLKASPEGNGRGPTSTTLDARTVVIVLGIASVVLCWAWWTTLLDISDRWANDPQYSHGFLVPLFSIYLVWRRRSEILPVAFQCQPWGIGLVGLGIVLRLAGLFFYQPWLDSGSLIVVIAGLVATLGGRKLLVTTLPAILFLCFMLPLPYRFQTMLGSSLQRIATLASTYALQTFGVPAVSEGNIILLTEARLGVVEACSGLTMLVTFAALSAGVAIVVAKSWVEKIVVLVSAIPIAIVSNIIRITVTGILFEFNQDDMAKVVFHDLAGWLMMPLGLTILLLELRLLKWILVPVVDSSLSARK